MPVLTLAHTVTIRPDVVYRELDGEVVLLSLESGLYYGLDPMGTRIWELIVCGGTLAEIRDTLLEEYDVSAERLDADLLSLVTRLVDKGLLDVATTSA